jgi:hypothetical protein
MSKDLFFDFKKNWLQTVFLVSYYLSLTPMDLTAKKYPFYGRQGKGYCRSMLKNAQPIDPWSYVHTHRVERIVGNACCASLLLPLLNSRLRTLRPFAGLVQIWLPTHRPIAAAIGGFAGLAEDTHARIAWQDALESQRAVEATMWTMRSLIPATLFFLNPFLGIKALDGEMKGADSALASIEKRPVVAWPFFAVLLPKEATDSSRFHFQYVHMAQSCTGIISRIGWNRDVEQIYPQGVGEWVHLLSCRMWNGYYEIERREENARWRVI